MQMSGGLEYRSPKIVGAGGDDGLGTVASAPAGVGRRDRKKLATRHALRSAALRLVAERGLHRVTVEDVAEEADVSVRTFFNHFATKEEAVIGLDPDQAERFTEALVARPEEEAPLQALHGVLAELADTIAGGEDDWLLRMEVVKRIPELAPRLMASFAAYERALVEGVALRTGTDPDADLYPLCTALTAVAAFRSAMVFWHNHGHRPSLRALLDDAFLLAAGGCPSPTAPPATSGAICPTTSTPRPAASTPDTKGRPCPHP